MVEAAVRREPVGAVAQRGGAAGSEAGVRGDGGAGAHGERGEAGELRRREERDQHDRGDRGDRARQRQGRQRRDHGSVGRSVGKSVGYAGRRGRATQIGARGAVGGGRRGADGRAEQLRTVPYGASLSNDGWMGEWSGSERPGLALSMRRADCGECARRSKRGRTIKPIGYPVRMYRCTLHSLFFKTRFTAPLQSAVPTPQLCGRGGGGGL